jgi:predicted ester cyclase
VTPEPPAMPRIEFCTAADIVAENPQMEPLIEGFLNKGESLVIHAPGGVGKSMIQQFIALAVAKQTDDPWLLFDKFEIRQEMASLFIQSENSKAAVNKRYRGMIQADPNRLKNIYFPTIHGDVMLTGKSFEDKAFINHIVEMIRQIEEARQQKIDLLFVDPLVSYHNGDENDAGRMRAALDGLTQACQRAKVTPIVAHHDNRQGEYRGSSAIYDWTRNMVKMKRVFVGEDRIIDFKDDQPIKRVAKIPCIEFEHEKANNLPRFEKFTLNMNQDFVFRLVDNSLPPEIRERCHEVQQALRDLGGTAESHNQLAKAVHELSGRSLSTCKTDVAKAVQHEFIEKHSTGDKSKPYAYTIDD